MKEIHSLSSSNLHNLVEMALKLWPDSTSEEELEYFEGTLDDAAKNTFLIQVADGYIGFIHTTLRSDYVEGTSTKPVCYIEGIYVEPEFRKQGIGQILVKEVEKWGKQLHCTEMGSDAEITNRESINFHKKTGFREVNRVVCFAKQIGS